MTKQIIVDLLQEAMDLVEEEPEISQSEEILIKLNRGLNTENEKLKKFLCETICMAGVEGVLEDLLHWEEPLPHDKVQFVKLLRKEFGFTLPQCIEIWNSEDRRIPPET